jgi:hypothetical protein
MRDYLSDQQVEPQISGKLGKYPEVDAALQDYRQSNTTQPTQNP